MAQVKIYALKNTIKEKREILSDVVHTTIVNALKIPEDKRFQRFFSLEQADFIYPAPRSEEYLIIEIYLIQGRNKETKKLLIKQLFENLNTQMNLSLQDIEIVIIESPAENWGFRGVNGDDANLNYKINL